MSAADVRQYAEVLRAVGFSEPRFADVRPWTRYLLAERPACGVSTGGAPPRGSGAAPERSGRVAGARQRAPATRPVRKPSDGPAEVQRPGRPGEDLPRIAHTGVG